MCGPTSYPQIKTRETDKGLAMYSMRDLDAQDQERIQTANEQATDNQAAPREAQGRKRDGSLSQDGTRWQRGLENARRRLREQGALEADNPLAQVEVDADLGATPEFSEAAANASQAGLTVIPVTNTSYFDGGLLGDMVFVAQSDNYSIQEIIDHEIFHALNGTPTAQAMVAAVRWDRPAFAAYKRRLVQLHIARHRAAGHSVQEANRMAREHVTDSLVAEEIAADYFAGIRNKYGINLADSVNPLAMRRLIAEMREGIAMTSPADPGLFQASARDRSLVEQNIERLRPTDPLISPTGHQDWPTFTEWDSKQSRGEIKPMPIRVLKGKVTGPNRGYGWLHIKAEHAKQFPTTAAIESFVHDALLNFNEVYREGNRLTLFSTRPNRVAIVELREENGAYSVITAFPKGKAAWKPRGLRILGGRRAAFAQSARAPGRTAQEGTRLNLPREPLPGKDPWEYLRQLSKNVKPEESSTAAKNRRCGSRFRELWGQNYGVKNYGVSPRIMGSRIMGSVRT